MTTIDALHGRARVGRAERRCRRLLVALAFAFVVLQLEQLVRVHSTQAAHSGIPYGALSLYVRIRQIDLAVYVLGFLLGGTLVDAFGPSRVIGVLLIGWCGLVVLGGAMDPATNGLFAPLATNLMPGCMFVAALTVVRASMATRRRGPAVALLLVGFGAAWSSYNQFDLYHMLFGTPAAGDHAAWQYPMFALATFGAMIAGIWLLLVRESDAAAGLDRRSTADRSFVALLREAVSIAGRPAVWGLIAMQFCSTVVFYDALDQVWTFTMLRQGAVQTPVIVTVVTIPIATLVFAGWSDWSFRRTRSFTAARRPFVVLGFLAGGFVPLLAGVLPQRILPLTIVAALGLAAMRALTLVVIDMAPRRTAGTFIGVVLSGALAFQVALQFIQSLGSMFHPCLQILVWPLALVGAILSALLLPRLSLPDDRVQDVRIADHF